MFDDHPEELPPLHQSMGLRQLTLLQFDLGHQGSLEACFKGNEEFAVQGTEGAAVREGLEGRRVFARGQKPFVGFFGASGSCGDSPTGLNPPIVENAGARKRGDFDLIGFLGLAP